MKTCVNYNQIFTIMILDVYYILHYQTDALVELSGFKNYFFKDNILTKILA